MSSLFGVIRKKIENLDSSARKTAE